MISISNLTTSVVSQLNVGNIGLGAFLNGIGVPGLSEVLLPLGGVAIRQGRIDAVTLLIVATLCQVAGMIVEYLIARFGGIVLIERYGKYLLISGKEMASARRAFDRYGNGLVIFGAFIPGIQGFIGYVAGVAEMNFLRFVISVFIGKLVWVGGLLYLGYVLGNHLNLIDQGLKQVGALVMLALVVLVVWYIRSHRAVSARATKEN